MKLVNHKIVTMLKSRRSMYKTGLSVAAAAVSRKAVTADIRKQKKEACISRRRQCTDLMPSSAMVPSSAPLPSGSHDGDDMLAVHTCAHELFSERVEEREKGALTLRRLLSKHRPPVQAVLQIDGLLPRIVALLHADTSSPDMQVSMAWCLTNVAAEPDMAFSLAVTAVGALPVLVARLSSPVAAIREQCIWCLANVAAEFLPMTELVLETPGVLDGLLENLHAHTVTSTMLSNCISLLSVLCRCKKGERFLPFLPLLIPLLPVHEEPVLDKEDLIEICEILRQIVCGNEACRQATVCAGVVPGLVQLLLHSDNKVVEMSLKVVGEIVCGEHPDLTQAFIDAGALPTVVALMSRPSASIRRGACWVASNVAAGTVAQATALVCVPGAAASLIVAVNGAEARVRTEALWALANIMHNCEYVHLKDLVDQGVLPCLARAMGRPSVLSVPELGYTLVYAIDHLLESGRMASTSDFADAIEQSGLHRVLEEIAMCTTDAMLSEIIEKIIAKAEDEGEGEADGEAEAQAEGFWGVVVPLPLVDIDVGADAMVDVMSC